MTKSVSKKTSKADIQVVHFTQEQKAMLLLRKEDNKHGRLITQEELDTQDQKWLNRLHFGPEYSK